MESNSDRTDRTNGPRFATPKPERCTGRRIDVQNQPDDYGATVRAACDGLSAMLIRSFEDVLADPDYGDASGHLGGVGLSMLAEVAIDTVFEYLRGTTDAIIARNPGRIIEITNRDEDH